MRWGVFIWRVCCMCVVLVLIDFSLSLCVECRVLGLGLRVY